MMPTVYGVRVTRQSLVPAMIDPMALSSKLLGTDEYVVRHMRTHSKALVGPILIFILLAALVGLALAFFPVGWGWIPDVIVIGVALVLAVMFCVMPCMKWLSSTYTLTNRRIITRRGIITKTGHDLPLQRINNVSYERGLVDRLFACGTLILTTAAEVPVILPDIPDVERVHVEMTELLFGDKGEISRVERDENHEGA